MARLIKSDGTEAALIPKNHRHFTLEELQAAVGGYIELVPGWASMRVFCNEQGKLFDYPFNEKATRLWHAALRGDGHAPRADDVLVGDVLICLKEEVE